MISISSQSKNIIIFCNKNAWMMRYRYTIRPHFWAAHILCIFCAYLRISCAYFGLAPRISPMLQGFSQTPSILFIKKIKGHFLNTSKKEPTLPNNQPLLGRQFSPFEKCFLTFGPQLWLGCKTFLYYLFQQPSLPMVFHFILLSVKRYIFSFFTRGSLLSPIQLLFYFYFF